MNIEIKKELTQAQKLYKSKKYEQAFEIFDKHYKMHPEVMKYLDKNNYAWSIYYIHVQHFKDVIVINSLHFLLFKCSIIKPIIYKGDINEYGNKRNVRENYKRTEIKYEYNTII